MSYKPMYPVFFGWYVVWLQNDEYYTAGCWWTYVEAKTWMDK
jgi:hypothetical protein